MQVAETRQHVRLQFELEGTRKEQEQVLQALKQSSVARKRRPSGPGADGMTPSERVIPFVKANACGNDFLIIDGVYVPADLAEFSKRICDRHHGVGADGVEWLFPAPTPMCERDCSTPTARKRKFPATAPAASRPTSARSGRESKFAIRTGAGIKTCTLISRSESRYEFEIAMGEPQVGDEIPDQAGIR